MRLASVNVGLPRTVTWHGMTVTTGIYKDPVEGRVALRRLNLKGDQQADLTVHGGADKAAYCYPLMHYEYWKKELPGHELPIGVFGENFTTEGLSEEGVFVGDRFSIGSAEVIVTQPRLPCYKLGIRFGSDDMVRRFLVSGRSGFYLSVAREGDVAAGDAIALIRREPESIAISEVTRLFLARQYSHRDAALAKRAQAIAALPQFWKDSFEEQLALTERRWSEDS